MFLLVLHLKISVNVLFILLTFMYTTRVSRVQIIFLYKNLGYGNSLVLHCASLLRTIFASSARAHGRVHVQNARDYPQTELENGINSSFLLNEQVTPDFFQVFAKNSLRKNIFKEEKKFDSRTRFLGGK